jgi:predicted metal-binding protein
LFYYPFNQKQTTQNTQQMVCFQPTTNNTQQTTTQHTLFVCKTCATLRVDGKPQGKSGGEQLLEQLQELHSTWELKENFQLQEVDCMSACSNSCVISFSATGKYTYLFGDLPAKESAAAVLDCAKLYFTNPDGYLAWADRPKPLKNGIIARIPPLPKLS